MGAYTAGVANRSSQGLLINLNFRVYSENQEASLRTTRRLLLISKAELAARRLTKGGHLSAPRLQNSCAAGNELSWNTYPVI